MLSSKPLRILTASALLSLLTLVVFASPAMGKPNILLILVDDLGARDPTFTGSDFYETPHIDRLARGGMTFSDAYACASNCAPSRACLLSGRYPVRHDVYSVFPLDHGPKPAMRLVPAKTGKVLPGETVTIAERLRDAGYATGMFGKWNVGMGTATQPAAQGFQTAAPRRRPTEEDFELTGDAAAMGRITDAASRFIEVNRDRPFFAFVSHHSVHFPHRAAPQRVAKYERKPSGKRHSDATFAAMLEELDAWLGVLLQRIEKLGLTENTLVVLTSDNGGLAVSPQTPLRGFKGSYYEGGIRVPLVVRWPGVVTPGSTCAVPVSNVDLFPTLLQAAGAPPEGDPQLDGVSLVPLLEDPGMNLERTLFWHLPGYLFGRNAGARDRLFQSRPVTVARRGPWKLHLNHEEWALDGGREELLTNGALELYDLTRDPGEKHSLVRAEPKVRDELLEEILAFLEETGAPVPSTPNPAYRKRRRVRKPAT